MSALDVEDAPAASEGAPLDEDFRVLADVLWKLAEAAARWQTHECGGRQPRSPRALAELEAGRAQIRAETRADGYDRLRRVQAAYDALEARALAAEAEIERLRAPAGDSLASTPPAPRPQAPRNRSGEAEQAFRDARRGST